jgi:membrane peptidoglycan carboxypeptidase
MRFVMPVISSRYLLAAGIFLMFCGFAVYAMPSLDGVEKGVFIKIRSEGRVVQEKFISPRSPGFVRSDKLPGYVAGAIIAAEDEDFYRHNGVSLDETMHALVYDIEHGAFIAGGSTITQQLVKNVYLTGKKTLGRKLVEAVTAVRLEKKLSKKQILDYYLNIIEFGNGIYGIRQAASVYFDKQPQDLTAEEAAALAVIMPKPIARGRALKQGIPSIYQQKRVSYILHRMKKLGYLHQNNV